MAAAPASSTVNAEWDPPDPAHRISSVPRIDAFISYARAESAAVASALQVALERFAKPWYRARSGRVFRDDASMAANTDLWGTIRNGLEGAEWLIVLASPAAAASAYMDKEIAWWLEHKSADRVLLVLVAGELAWSSDLDGFAPEASTALPPRLLTAFADEPRWVDLRWFLAPDSLGADDPRFPERVADLCAPIRGVERAELVGENVRQHRRALRLARGGVAGLALLLVLSLIATVVAVRQFREATAQRNAAVAQNTISVARQLAASAVNLADSDLQQASLVAVSAFRLHRDPQTAAALYSVASASQHLVGFFDAGAPVTATGGTGDGRFLYAGTDAGTVLRFDRATGEVEELMDLDHPVFRVLVSADGNTVAASAGPTDATGVPAWAASGVWRRGTVTRVDHEITALSGSGDLTATAAVSDDASVVTLRVFRGADLALDTTVSDGGRTLDFTGDGDLVTFDDGYGDYSVVDVATGRVRARGALGFGTWNFGADLSPGGGHLTYTNGAKNVKVWTVGAALDIDKPSGYAPTTLATIVDMALSADGELLATSAPGRIDVGRRVEKESDVVPPLTLLGGGDAAPGTLRFLSKRFLVSAAGTGVSLWDLNQAGRLGEVLPAEVPPSCSACRAGDVVVSPQGRRAIVFDESHDRVASVDLDRRTSSDPFEGSALSGTAAAWLDDDRVVTWHDATQTVAIRSGHDLGTEEAAWTQELRLPTEENRPLPAARLRGSAAEPHLMLFAPDGLLADLDLTRRTQTSWRVDLGSQDVARTGFDASGERAWALTSTTTNGTEWQSRLVVVDTATGEVIASHTVDDGLHGAQITGGRLWTWGDKTPLTARGLGRDTEPVASRLKIGSNAAASPDLPFVVQDVQGVVSIVDLELGTVVGSFTVPSAVRQKSAFGFSPGSRTLMVATEAADDTSGPAVRSVRFGYDAWIDAACRTAGRDLTLDEWRALTDLEPPDLRCRR